VPPKIAFRTGTPSRDGPLRPASPALASVCDWPGPAPQRGWPRPELASAADWRSRGSLTSSAPSAVVCWCNAAYGFWGVSCSTDAVSRQRRAVTELTPANSFQTCFGRRLKRRDICFATYASSVMLVTLPRRQPSYSPATILNLQNPGSSCLPGSTSRGLYFSAGGAVMAAASGPELTSWAAGSRSGFDPWHAWTASNLQILDVWHSGHIRPNC